MSEIHDHRGALRLRFTELETAVGFVVDALTEMRTALNNIDPTILGEAPQKELPQPTRPYIIDPFSTAPNRSYQALRRANRGPNNVLGGQRGAVAESMRRAIATEAMDALKRRPDIALSTSELLPYCPTAAERYVGHTNQVAGIGSILRTMGERYGIKNVSTHTRARWMYRTEILLKSPTDA